MAQVIPIFRPEITQTPAGPAVKHADGVNQVTLNRPARPGEQLSLFAFQPQRALLRRQCCSKKWILNALLQHSKSLRC